MCTGIRKKQKTKNTFETSTLDPAMLSLLETKMQCVSLLVLQVV